MCCSENHPNYYIIENGQNTKKNPRDLRRLVTQTLVKDHPGKLKWKTNKVNIIIIIMEIRPNRQNETQFLPGSGHIDTAIWMHYMDANKTAGEETRWQLHKNAACNPEQVLAAIPPQDTNCTATCPLSRKLFKLDEPDMQDTAGKAEMNS